MLQWYFLLYFFYSSGSKEHFRLNICPFSLIQWLATMNIVILKYFHEKEKQKARNHD